MQQIQAAKHLKSLKPKPGCPHGWRTLVGKSTGVYKLMAAVFIILCFQMSRGRVYIPAAIIVTGEGGQLLGSL